MVQGRLGVKSASLEGADEGLEEAVEVGGGEGVEGWEEEVAGWER